MIKLFNKYKYELYSIAIIGGILFTMIYYLVFPPKCDVCKVNPVYKATTIDFEQFRICKPCIVKLKYKNQ